MPRSLTWSLPKKYVVREQERLRWWLAYCGYWPVTARGFYYKRPRGSLAIIPTGFQNKSPCGSLTVPPNGISKWPLHQNAECILNPFDWSTLFSGGYSVVPDQTSPQPSRGRSQRTENIRHVVFKTSTFKGPSWPLLINSSPFLPRCSRNIQ